MLTGYRTYIVGLALAIAPSALSYLGGIDWTKLGISTNIATLISGVLMLGMRTITTTPPTKGA